MYRVSFSCYVHSISYASIFANRIGCRVDFNMGWVQWYRVQNLCCFLFHSCRNNLTSIQHLMAVFYQSNGTSGFNWRMNNQILSRLQCTVKREVEISFEDRQQGPKCSNAQPNEKRHQFWRCNKTSPVWVFRIWHLTQMSMTQSDPTCYYDKGVKCRKVCELRPK